MTRRNGVGFVGAQRAAATREIPNPHRHAAIFSCKYFYRFSTSSAKLLDIFVYTEPIGVIK
jgi:hypothetical protein